MLTIGKDAITGKAGKTLYTIFILVCIVVVSYFIYSSITNIIESTNRTAAEQNVAVAVKAKADLENATKELNKAAENYRLLQEKLKAEEELREKNKLIIENNKKELDKVVKKIDSINNKDVSYEETAIDREKSEIIIDGIWEIYKGKQNEKNNKS